MKKNYLIILLAFICIISNAQYTKLFDFAGTNGKYPNGPLVSDGTFFYGISQRGGTSDSGVIFKIKPDGTGYVKLLDFAGAINGSIPNGGLHFDGTYLYGMTYKGGVNNMGVIYKIMPDGTGYSKLLDFSGAATGRLPSGSLISDGTFLYGMTELGGANNYGVLFKIKPDGTGYATILDFGGSNGRSPIGALLFDGTLLYGMTWKGGTNGLGVAFSIKPDGTSYSKLLDFTGLTNGSEPTGTFISDGTFLYAMTSTGGISNMGTVFKIMPDGTGYSKLLDFAGATNGNYATRNLFFHNTFLYGMVRYGGTNNNGVLFKIKPDGSAYSTLLNFAGPTNGSWPESSLISDGTFLYGTTGTGGSASFGTIFKYQDSLEANVLIHNKENNFNIFPNPFSSQTTLQTAEHLQNASLTVYNSVGLTVKRIDNLAGQTITFNRDNLPSGLYFVRLTQDGNTISADKFVIVDE